MTIDYIWIDQYNNISGQAITLSSKYIFKTDIDKETHTGKITVLNNPAYIDDFFSASNIKEVSAIIGKNGAGKTSILDFIKSNFPRGFSGTENTIVITSDDKNIYIIKPDDWKFKIENQTSLNEIHKGYNNNSGTNRKFSDVSGLSNFDYFYYNFFLDYKFESGDMHGLKDLSTSTLLCKQRKSIVENRWNHLDCIPNFEASTFDLTLLKGNEILKAIQLITSEEKSLIPFKIPEYLYITISQRDKIDFLSNRSKYQNSEIGNKTVTLIKTVEERNKRLEIEERTLNNLYLAVLLYFLNNTSFPDLIQPYTIELQDNISVEDFVISFFEKITITGRLEDNTPVTYSRNEKIGKVVPLFIKQIDQYKKEKTLISSNENVLKLPMIQGADKKFDALFEAYNKQKVFDDFLDFDWRGISTGQQSFLSFMSRFYHEKHYAIGRKDLKSKLFIMIDEGDAGFHPDWQKLFFDHSLTFLSKLFKGTDLQLVYTSNSPYIVSDLTKNHITFIENNENGVQILDKENNHLETFGQNIHTLLSDSFFLQGGLIGEFAKKKINEAIETIKTADKKKYNTGKLIQQIGEPVIRRKLTSMYESEFLVPIDIDAEIEETEARLKELKKLKGNDSDI